MLTLKTTRKKEQDDPDEGKEQIWPNNEFQKQDLKDDLWKVMNKNVKVNCACVRITDTSTFDPSQPQKPEFTQPAPQNPDRVEIAMNSPMICRKRYFSVEGSSLVWLLYGK